MGCSLLGIAQATPTNAPFGLQWGSTLTQVLAQQPGLVQIQAQSPNRLRVQIDRLPHNYSVASHYQLDFDDVHGLCQIEVFVKDMALDALDREVARLKLQLETRYGAPTVQQLRVTRYRPTTANLVIELRLPTEREPLLRYRYGPCQTSIPTS